MPGPNPLDPHPMRGFPQVCFIKNTVKNPNIVVGDYTYYDDPEASEDFERNVLYHFPFIGDKLIIGKFCAIARGVRFIMNGANHKTNGLSTYPFFIFGNGWEEVAPAPGDLPHKGDTVVGNDVWIGYQVTVMPGVRIGDGAIIASGSVVTSDVAPFTIVGGNPAKPVKVRFNDAQIAKLLEVAWWDWPIDVVSANLALIVGNDVEALAAVKPPDEHLHTQRRGLPSLSRITKQSTFRPQPRPPCSRRATQSELEDPTEASKAGGALHNQDRSPTCSRCQPFIMDKFLLQQQVLERLAEDLLQAEQAARAAHEAATHEENIAENKYDTLGLEAAYLATGQARRADAIRQAMANWRQFRPRPYDASKGIQLGALVCLVDSDDKQQQLFLGPDGGSMKLVSGAELVQVISSEAPLGRAMLGKCEGDEVSIQVAPIRQQFEVLRVH